MSRPESLLKKIPSPEQLDRLLAYWHFKDQTVVFTNGCFDLVHLGHIDYLVKAADLGNVLVVGLNSDASTRKLKGPSRPINHEHERAMMLAAFSFVSAVVLFDEDTPYNLIRKIQPVILVKGADYKPEDIVGYDIVSAKGGKIITLDYLQGYSTTALEQKIRGLQY